MHIREWLSKNPDERRGAKGSVRKSNRTDNESAKMATGKGVIHGYTGVAAVDQHAQIMVEAQAHGTGSETELLIPVVNALHTQLATRTVITADAGYHSEANLQQLHAMHVDALIADYDLRRRDECFATQARYLTLPNPLHNKAGSTTPPSVFVPSDFTYDADARTCVCPAGESLYRRGQSRITNGFIGEHFRGAKRDCGPCALRARCLRTPDTTPVRNVAFFRDRERADQVNHTGRMKARIDRPQRRAQYGQRFATVELVFANLCHNKRLDRFTLRGRVKVNAQWQWYCLVHNIEKLVYAGYAA